jgi:hypothetical protein
MVILQYSLLSLCLKLYNSSIVKNAKTIVKHSLNCSDETQEHWSM